MKTILIREKKYTACFSGGKDSAAVVLWLKEKDLLERIISIDTGISTPDWLPFIKKQCNEWGYEPEVYKTPASYDQLVKSYGFPGPPLHYIFMNYLKGRAIRAFKKVHPNAVLASGVRLDESARRFRNTKEWGYFENVPTWAPLYNWTTEQVWEYVTANGYTRSPAYQTLCISGDCLCGAYATSLERSAIKAFYPGLWDRIDKLEKETKTQWGWANNQGKRGKKTVVCTDCEAK
ncbi:MAG TPA: phosphoadenosine phosphosulfate reductase family protein [Gammaproteobacteria bacterium]|nr:phosphoadenosine phosphosulfate reductase family protein [Gammaproteobacteria bacterium]